MALSIRLARGGAKKRPYYRIVVADARSPRDGRFIEKIGTYNPLLAKDSPERVKLDAERASHWLKAGAQPSDRVARFLDVLGVKERSARNNPNKGKPGEKATERAETRAAREAELAEAAAAAAAAPKPEAPAAEPEAPAAEPEAPIAAADESAPTQPEPAEGPAEGDAEGAGAPTQPEPAEGGNDAAPAEGAEKAE